MTDLRVVDGVPEARTRVAVPASLLLVVDGAALAVLAVLHVVNHATVRSRLLDMDAENNLPTWLSSGSFLAAAGACAVAAAASRGAGRLGLALVALFALASSVDEAASVHEVAGERLGAAPTLSVTQPLAVVAVALLLLWTARRVPVARRLLVAATGLLVASQACASVAGLWTTGATQFALETVEDTTETLVAILLLAAGLAAGGARLDLRPAALRREWRRWTGSGTGGDGGDGTAGDHTAAPR